MELLFSETEQVDAALQAAMEQAARLCVTGEGLDPDRCQISVSFVAPAEIRELNRTYRATDRVTDVLSFPQYEAGETLPAAGVLCLGDVVICRARAEAQAETFGHSVARELLYLFTHSVLHLLGYDHMEPSDKQRMRAREEAVMDALGVRREPR